MNFRFASFALLTRTFCAVGPCWVSNRANPVSCCCEREDVGRNWRPADTGLSNLTH